MNEKYIVHGYGSMAQKKVYMKPPKGLVVSCNKYKVNMSICIGRKKHLKSNIKCLMRSSCQVV